MWIKALDRPIWVNMKHITHFEIEHKALGHGEPPYHVAYAYLNASGSSISKPSGPSISEGQARILVCQGSREECEQFIVEKQFLEGAFQWLGYLVAGGIGAILTLIFQSLRT